VKRTHTEISQHREFEMTQDYPTRIQSSIPLAVRGINLSWANEERKKNFQLKPTLRNPTLHFTPLPTPSPQGG